MQIKYALPVVGLIATGVVGSPVPEAEANANADAAAQPIEARAEQAGQFFKNPYPCGPYGCGGGRRQRGNRFTNFDPDFIDILKRDAEPAEQGAQFFGRPNRFDNFDPDFIDILKRDAEPAKQGAQHFNRPCGWGGCQPDFFDDDDDEFVNFDPDFIDILKRDAEPLQARAEQAKQAEQHYYKGGDIYRPRRFPNQFQPHYIPNRRIHPGYVPGRRGNWNPNWIY